MAKRENEDNKPAVEVVRIEKMVFGGDGLARLKDGRAVFIPYSLPGEKLKVRITETKKRFARAEILEILEPSKDRISPKCPHFTVCGGCHYQHLPYEKQVRMKEKVFREQLDRIAGIKGEVIRPLVKSPVEWNYRDTVQFHISEAGKPGYQSSRSHEVVEITECHLPMEPINEVWPLLDLAPYPGLERIDIKAGSDDEILLVFNNNGLDLPTLELDLPVSAVNISPYAEIVMAGDNYLLLQVLEKTFSVSAGSFFQVNPLMAAEMVRYVMTEVPFNKETTVLDVYCGVGLFSAFFAPLVKSVVGIEVSASACQDFVINLDEFENIQLYEGLAEDILPGLDLKPDLVLVDPPRAGLEGAALDAIVDLQPETLVYVSCDPATLARDLSRLQKAGYQVEKITPFDLFPQTYHIESISLLKYGGVQNVQ